MYIKILLALLMFVSGCAAGAGAGAGTPSETASPKSGVYIFNPFIHSRLPSSEASPEKQAMLKQLGGKSSNIQDEVAKRPRWREEVYPIIFGPKSGKHEVLVFIDFSKDSSLGVWRELIAAKDKMNPKDTTVAVFGVSGEKYGTELMGCGIWVSYAYPAQGMAYFNHVLTSWDAAKKAQVKKYGKAKNFVYEYDSVSSDDEQPFIYSFMNKFKLPDGDLTEVIKYGFDAGNVNAFEARNVAANYGVKTFPGIVVDGAALKNPKASDILKALK